LFSYNESGPIYLQLAERIEDAILSGAFPEESQIPSTTDISSSDKMNPATALKGINLLVEENIIYKKRGLGMFVSTGAVERIAEKRKKLFFENYVKTLISEAYKLKLTRGEIITMIERGFEQ